MLPTFWFAREFQLKLYECCGTSMMYGYGNRSSKAAGVLWYTEGISQVVHCTHRR